MISRVGVIITLYMFYNFTKKGIILTLIQQVEEIKMILYITVTGAFSDVIKMNTEYISATVV